MADSTIAEQVPPVVARVGVVVALLVVATIVVVSFSSIQGSPPASTWDGLQQEALQRDRAQQGGYSEAIAPRAQHEQIRVVQAGDTLWEIALELDPGADPRSLVDILATRNGGSALRVGQELIIPATALS